MTPQRIAFFTECIEKSGFLRNIYLIITMSRLRFNYRFLTFQNGFLKITFGIFRGF